MARPLIALLTDFGLRDHYVGVMKGVALGICPDAQFVDLSHNIPPQDIAAGARVLDASYRYFPLGTVFLCVVDPGVGSERRGIAIEADGWCFVGPDNGLLARVFARAERRRGVELTSTAHALPTISRTFEGRDRFAPAAAWVARGAPLEALGPSLVTLVSPAWTEARVTGETIAGQVVAIDRFGNLITNIDRALLDSKPDVRQVRMEGEPIGPIVQTYADVPVGSACAVIGSDECLEIAIRKGSAAAHFNQGVGAAVQVCSLAW